MGTTVTTKKIKLYPMGDKEEVDRVYDYIKDAQYSQYKFLNRFVCQVHNLYWKYDGDIKDPNYKEEFNAIFRVNNEETKDIPKPKGLDTFSAAGMRVKSDYSTALKNGYAKGDRKLPSYKRDFPLMVSGRFLKVFKEDDLYVIKFVNKIWFKVIVGTRGKNNFYLIDMLEKLADENPKYSIGGSQIKIQDGKIFLFLVVKIEKEDTGYVPKKDKVMGVAYGYQKPLVCCFSDSDEALYAEAGEDYITKRQEIQERRRELQGALKTAQGGRGRQHKLKGIDNNKLREKNYIKNVNHIISKKIVEQAVKNKVETIVLEDVSLDVKKYPALLRNWTYFQLDTFIDYKAKSYGINVLKPKNAKAGKICCKCGEILEDEVFPQDILWSSQISLTCSHCKAVIDYDFNKAKNLASRPEILVSEDEAKKKKEKKKTRNKKTFYGLLEAPTLRRNFLTCGLPQGEQSLLSTRETLETEQRKTSVLRGVKFKYILSYL